MAEKNVSVKIAYEFFFLVGIDGVLMESGSGEVSLDEKGKAIPGAVPSPFKTMDIEAPEIRKRFQREIDFWIKGIGRKAAAPRKTAD